MTTRGVRLSRTSFKSAFRIAGEFARSISPDTSKIVVLSSCRLEICTVYSPSRLLLVSILLSGAHVLDQSETVGPFRALEFDDIHTLLNKMQPKSTRLYFFELSYAKLRALNGRPSIAELDLEPIRRLSIGVPMDRAEEHFNRLVGAATVGMPDNVR